MTRPTQAKVVAVIPSLNTASTIHEVVSKAKKYVNQVLVIDDGSHDGALSTVRIRLKNSWFGKGKGK